MVIQNADVGRVLELVSKQEELNPFVRDEKGIFIRFDKIQVSQPVPDQFLIEFYFKGEAVFSMNESCDFRSGELLTLTGFEGQTQVECSSAFCGSEVN